MRQALIKVERMRQTPIIDDDFPRIRDEADQAVSHALTLPTIVCLCGSSRFWEAYRDHGLRLTLEGKIVLSIGISTPAAFVFAHSEDEQETKRRLDELHLRKIDLADEILVLNVGGYIGQSTQREINYATRTGKLVRWLEPRKEGSSLMNLDALTWTCHVCGRTRPDAAISVYQTERMVNGVLITQNVRYCNDDPECTRRAAVLDFMTGILAAQ